MSIDRFRGCLLGLAAGDAVGTTLEFKPPGSFKPIHDMVGGGPFRLKPGKWTDETSMALCLATSLLENGRIRSQGSDGRVLLLVDRRLSQQQWNLFRYWQYHLGCFAGNVG
jgi:ADP-ribosylglycohydrolase